MADTTVGFQFEACSPEIAASPVVSPHEARAESRVEDAEMAAALRSGVESAYEALLDRFEQPVFNMVSRLMADPVDAADVVQEVFLKVFRYIGSFRGDSSLKTWIYRIAVNEARNHRRWFTRHRQQEVAIEAGLGNESGETRGYSDWLADSSRSPYETTLDREVEALIERALAQVNPKFRAALVLREIEGLSYEEIAEILEISLGTVKSRILRGRDALRKQLAGRLELQSQDGLDWSPQMAE